MEGQDKILKVSIDGKQTAVKSGTTILNAARRVGIEIPTLCHHPALEPYGVCRVCIVEMKRGKRSRIVTACNFPIQDEGLEISTNSERIQRLRKEVEDEIKHNGVSPKIDEPEPEPIWPEAREHCFGVVPLKLDDITEAKLDLEKAVALTATKQTNDEIEEVRENQRKMAELLGTIKASLDLINRRLTKLESAK